VVAVVSFTVGPSAEPSARWPPAPARLASKTLRDLRVAEICKLDMKVEGGKVVAYRARVSLSHHAPARGSSGRCRCASELTFAGASTRTFITSAAAFHACASPLLDPPFRGSIQVPLDNRDIDPWLRGSAVDTVAQRLQRAGLSREG
jgi:hypothetical protein